MNKKSLDKLESFLSALDAGAVQPKELIQAIETVMSVVKQSNETIAKKVGENDTATKTKIKELSKDIDAAVLQLSNYSKTIDSEKASKADVERLQNNLVSELNRVVALIPKLPDEFDASDLYESIESHSVLIETMRNLLVGENLRNALEALPEGEKLAIEAVEGLREELDRLAKDWNKGGGGGIGSQIVLDIINSGASTAWLNGSGTTGSKITVSATEPTDPQVNDIWFDIS